MSKRRHRSKLEQKIRDLKLPQWPSARVMNAELGAKATAAAQAKAKAEAERWRRVVDECEAGARALHNRWLAEGLQNWLRQRQAATRQK
jgi:hypothetical protein